MRDNDCHHITIFSKKEIIEISESLPQGTKAHTKLLQELKVCQLNIIRKKTNWIQRKYLIIGLMLV